MTLSDFEYIFLPHLADSYQKNEAPFSVFVDRDLWETIYPMPTGNPAPGEFLWYQMRFSVAPLSDGTLLLTYTLPTPQRPGEDMYIAVRVRREDRRARLYVLRRPRYYDEPWDIYQLTVPDGKAQFDVKIAGELKLASFVHTIDGLDFDEKLHTSFFGGLKSFKDLIKGQ